MSAGYDGETPQAEKAFQGMKMEINGQDSVESAYNLFRKHAANVGRMKPVRLYAAGELVYLLNDCDEDQTGVTR